jgi:tetratricopeptide (TPR) repeat protein
MNTSSGPEPLAGKRVGFLGKLGGMNRRELVRFVRDQGGVAVENLEQGVDLLVIGAEELPLREDGDLLSDKLRELAVRGELRVLGETEFWEWLGFLPGGSDEIRQLYTPAMLAELLGVSVATVRRWHRRGLIVPAEEVHRLPYFDFQEVATARRLAQLVASGASPGWIEQKLSELSRYVPQVERPLAQLQIILEGRHLLLRQGEGLVDSAGQLWIDFEALEADSAWPQPVTLSLPGRDQVSEETLGPSDLLEQAEWLEDEGHLELAVEAYRAALAAGGGQPIVCFQLAELLYRIGDIAAARERYYMAIELDEDFVEARANLGCVLAEEGQVDLAVAAFQGALRYHPDYPDVHYHLARTLDDQGNSTEARIHWERFLEMASSSPWAEEARLRLDSPGPPASGDCDGDFLS